MHDVAPGAARDPPGERETQARAAEAHTGLEDAVGDPRVHPGTVVDHEQLDELAGGARRHRDVVADPQGVVDHRGDRAEDDRRPVGEDESGRKVDSQTGGLREPAHKGGRQLGPAGGLSRLGGVAPGDVDVRTITLQAGTTYQLTASGTAMSFTLHAPDGTTILASGGTPATFTPTQTGAHYVAVQALGTLTGNYMLMVGP